MDKKLKKGQSGGIAMALISRANAKERYYSDPNICKHCNEIIHPREYGSKIDWAGARAKQFCSKTCSAKFNNKQRELDPEFVNKRRLKNESLKNSKSQYEYDECSCGSLKTKKSKQCKVCRNSVSIDSKTYKFYKDKYKDWWSARVPVSRDARNKYKNSDKPKKCINCNYDKHYQVCHIKAVSEFNENTLIKEINDLDNLVALCPNCHWEYDHGLLKI